MKVHDVYIGCNEGCIYKHMEVYLAIHPHAKRVKKHVVINEDKDILFLSSKGWDVIQVTIGRKIENIYVCPNVNKKIIDFLSIKGVIQWL